MFINLPEKEEMRKIIIKLDVPRFINYKDGRKLHDNSLKTLKPSEEDLPCNLSGVYLIELNNKIEYVGKTIDLRNRVGTHLFLKDYPEINFVYFYEEKDIDKLLLVEAIYKFKYLGRNKISEKYSTWNKPYDYDMSIYKCNQMQKEFMKINIK